MLGTEKRNGSGIEMGKWVYVRLGFAGGSLGISDCGWLNEEEEEGRSVFSCKFVFLVLMGGKDRRISQNEFVFFF